MNDKLVVLVTGVAGYWGSKVAARLIAENERLALSEVEGQVDYHIIGMDSDAPEEPIKGLDFIQADVRNPLFIELLRSEQVQMVCHLAFMENIRPSEATFDLNVIGTMKVLGACAEAGVQKVVMRSSTMIYGANPSNPAFLTERHPFQRNRSYGSTLHWTEIESFCNGFRRQVPELILTILRFPNIVGPTVDSAMSRLLRQNPVPVLMGFDPLMQVIHENDVVEALLFSILNDVPGVFNVAAEGVLPLTKIIGQVGRFPLPIFHLFAYWGASLRSVTGLNPERHFPIELDYLRYPCVADLGLMHSEMGFLPTYTADEALREFAGQLRLSRYKTESPDLSYDEERLRDTLERRRRIREKQIGRAAESKGGNDAE